MLPHNGDPTTVAMYGVTMVLCGLLKSWAAPACNNPVFAEIVPGHLRTLVYSFDRCQSGLIAAGLQRQITAKNASLLDAGQCVYGSKYKGSVTRNLLTCLNSWKQGRIVHGLSSIS